MKGKFLINNSRCNFLYYRTIIRKEILLLDLGSSNQIDVEVIIASQRGRRTAAWMFDDVRTEKTKKVTPTSFLLAEEQHDASLPIHAHKVPENYSYIL